MTGPIDREKVAEARAAKAANEIRATRTMLRLCEPPTRRSQLLQDFCRPPEAMALAYCQTCTPPPEYLKCVLCDWECPATEKWRMKLHNDTRPKWCLDWAKKKAKKWGEQT